MKFKQYKKRLIIMGVVFFLLLFLHFIGVLDPVKRVVSWTFNPVLSVTHKIGRSISGIFNERQEIDVYEEGLKRLEEENKQLIEANAKLNLLEDENEALREHLLFQHKSEHKFVMANIISRGDIGTAQQRMEMITIDKGSDGGIYEGLAVLSGEGTIIGKVSQVSSNISEVLLSNNRDCRLAAKLINTDRTNGIVQGDLGLTLKMDFIPQSIDLAPETLVVSSGLEATIPAGLVIGKIAEVFKENNELWQQAIIEPLVDPANLLVVSVIIP